MHHQRPAQLYRALLHTLFVAGMTIAGITTLCLAEEPATNVAETRGISLSQLYKAALSYDPKYQAAIEGRNAANEETAIGRAPLLPEVAFSASEYNIDSSERSDDTLTGKEIETQYDSGRAQITAKQTLFDLRRWHNYQAGKLKTQLGESDFQGQEQELIARLTASYLEAVGAESELGLARAELVALEQQLQQATRSLEAGEGTITDVDEVTARRDLAKVHVIQAQDRLRISHTLLKRLTGVDITALRYLDPFQDLSSLKRPEVLEPPLASQPDNNPKVRSELTKAAIANEQRKATRAGHAPMLQAVGIVRENTQSGDNINTIDTEQNYVGLELQVPIFSGMGVTAATRQAASRYAQAQYNADAVLRDEQLKAEEAAARVLSGIARAEGLRLAVKSAQRNLVSMTKGFEAGQRTTTDVMDSEHHVFETYRELIDAEIEMLKYYTALQSSLGTLNTETLATIEALLSAPHPPTINVAVKANGENMP